MKKKLLSLCLALSLVLLPVLAAEGSSAQPEPAPGDVVVTTVTLQSPSPWTVPYLADARALKLIDDGYSAYITSPVTAEQAAALAGQVYAKLALLTDEPAGEPDWSAVGTTRGGVVNALGAAVKAAGFDGAEPVAALQALGALQGDGVSLALERECTYEEAMAMATRVILGAYDKKNAGSKGLLWKVTHGENTVYLLGTAHMDRGNLYPFHQTLRNAIQSAETVVLELDFQDQEGIAEFAAMQTYPEGDGLKEHVPAELYTRTVNAFAALGLTEEQTNTYKPWALSNTVTSLMASDESAGDAPMAIDLYVNAAAANAGKTVTGAETYAFQGGIFDTLSEDYLTQTLDTAVTMLEATLAPPADAPQEIDPEYQAALDEQEKMFADMMTAWQTADLELFNKTYDKSAIITSDDELSARLFTDRDPGMVKVAQSYLEQEGSHTTFIAFGAGHMVAPGGLVPELEKLGYTVEQVTEYQALPPTPVAEPDIEEEPTTITMTFAGDCLLAAYLDQQKANNFNGLYQTYGAGYFFQNVKDIFDQDDFTVVNLENVVSDKKLTPREKPGQKTPWWFKAPSSSTNVLTASGIEAVSLANNHTNDYGRQGYEDTKAALDRAGVQWGDESKTVYLEKDGCTIAVVCAGLWNSGDVKGISARVQEAEKKSDFQIVFFHGGSENVHAPEAWKVKACRALVDAGADLVVGAHPHVLQPKETYQGVDILYSLGNFCFGGNIKPENRTALYQVKLTVEKGAVTGKESSITPCYVYTAKLNNMVPAVIENGQEKQAVLDFMNGLRKSPV